MLGKTKDWNRNELALPSSSTTESDGQCCGGIVTAGNPPSSVILIPNTFNETSLCILENNGAKRLTSTKAIYSKKRYSKHGKSDESDDKIVEYFERA